ncbi:MAG: hypothetical protein OFPII_40240 [Osedax symbiont Rs1]|nr:MAG: hypothetical protein OFPII_40240 [Osedax symbiont Rs1]
MTNNQKLAGRRIAVIGAGVVGACCAAQLTLQGAQVTILDRAVPGMSGSSRGNAAHIAASEIIPMATPGIAFAAIGMLLDAKSPLKVPISQWPRLTPWLSRFILNSKKSIHLQHIKQLAEINQSVFTDVEQLFERTGLSNQLRRDGALYLYETANSLAKAASGFAIKSSYGFASQLITSDELYALEPNLAKVFAGAYHIPQWVTVQDPQKVVAGLIDFCLANGALLHCEEVVDFKWQQQADTAQTGVNLNYKNGRQAQFDQVVLSAGIWSKPLLKKLAANRLLEAERGYNLTYTDPGFNLQRSIVFGDRGVVATPLDHGLRIGGWAEFAGTKRPPNPKYFTAMDSIAAEMFPKLQRAQSYSWMGHRPSTPSSTPIIERSVANPNIIFATGHGHLGLTQGPSTAKRVLELLVSEV